MTDPVYDFACVDCGADTLELDEGYMVHDYVWPIATDGGMLCVGCLEARIGRRLEPGDFTAAKINWDTAYFHSDRLAAVLPPPPSCEVCGGPGVERVPRYGRARNVVVCWRHRRAWADAYLAKPGRSPAA